MTKIKKGDIVTHNSYNKDFLFIVKNIFLTPSSNKVILDGINKNINTIGSLRDLHLISSNKSLAYKKPTTGKILHLDGDKKYSKQAYKYYLDTGLNATVRNISENKQPLLLYKLLNIYTPDILIVTGHDAMIKKGKDFNNIYNYRS